MVKTIQWRGNLGSSQIADEYLRGLWSQISWQAIRDGEIPGSFFEFNFDTLPTTPPTTEGAFGLFTAFTSTGGTIAATTSGRGWTLASDGDNEGASIRAKSSPFKIARTTKKFVAEVQVKSSTITDTKHGIFVGLIENAALTATVPIAADGTLADQNLVGFHRLEGDGDYFDCVYKANGIAAVTVKSDAVAVASDTWVSLGMVYDPDADPAVHDPNASGTAKYNLTFYNNGVPIATRKQIPSADGTDFPNDVNMGFVFAVLNATGTTPGDSSIRRARFAQYG